MNDDRNLGQFSAVDRDVSISYSSDLVTRRHVGENILMRMVTILAHLSMPYHILDKKM